MPKSHIIQLDDKNDKNVLKEFSIIEEALASDIFLGIIYTTIPKLLVAVSTIV